MIKGNKAFSLTELLIVIVIIAVLFAAIAPIITKRQVSETHMSESIWNFVTGDSERDAYFDPGVETWTSSVYMGMIPTSNDKTAGKLVIDAGPITYNSNTYNQPQMQFRFSADSKQQGRGMASALLFLNDSSVIFGSSISPYNTSKSVIYGLSNLVNNNYAHSLTVFGNGAMEYSKIGSAGGSTPQYIIAVGHRAAQRIGASDTTDSVNGIYIGAGAGTSLAQTKLPPTGNIAVGYNSMAYSDTVNNDESKAETKGSHNVFLGAYTGNGFTSTSASYNTIVGTVYPGANASYNTIIGYDVYAKGDPNVSNLTAIGYNACSSLSGSSGSKVCIGADSGHSTNNTPEVFDTDSGEHIFLGGKPSSQKTRGFAGRSVLEVHNNVVNGQTYGNVVINSNLVVRGNFFPSDSNKVVYNEFKSTQDISGMEIPYYRCSSDSYRSILNYNNFVCTEFEQSNPKSNNVLVKKGNCSNDNGYPSGNGCPNITSDIRLKTDITENNVGLDMLTRLEPYYYTYKNDAKKVRHVGVIAQDLQKIFPDAVTKDKNGYLKIRFEDMFYALINSIKQLAQKLDNVKIMITSAKSDLIKIKADHKDIRKQISALDIRIRRLERK